MIRRAVLQDIPALMDIYNEAILHPPFFIYNVGMRKYLAISFISQTG